MRRTGDQSTVGARRFETYSRWSVYGVASLPVLSALGGAAAAGWAVVGEHRSLFTAALVLSLVLLAGTVAVSRWSLDLLVERPRPLAKSVVIAWLLAAAGLVATCLSIPAQEMRMTVAAVVGSVAASLVPTLDARRTLYLNASIAVLAVPLAALTAAAPVLTGLLLVTFIVWSCWSSAWLLRVLRELQQAHEDRAALALANERLRISRDLHDVFGRTLATIAVKSELASELVRHGGGEQAAQEISAVRQLAQDAGQEVRRVVRGETRVTWDGEVAGARSLLGSAGIRCTVVGDPVPEQHAEALARVVREGVTNVLHHSAATHVTLATTTEDEQVVLTIANDGAGRRTPRSDGGTGLRAMSERIGALGGRIHTSRDGDWFLLEATVPLSAVPSQPGPSPHGAHT